VRSDDIPKPMVSAILAAEDKHFFRHHGFDFASILRAMWIDIKGRRDSQGASTVTQQLARTLWLGPERGWRRKIPETLITLHLEQVRTKRQILEDYVNSIYLGHAGSFSIHGFAKASNLYLGKDLSQVTVADAALLAGLVQAPDTRNPFRHPDRAMARRNAILKSMLADGFVNRNEYQAAVASPLNTVQGQAESTDAPYFVDLVNETLQNRFQDYDFLNNSFKVYTTLDMQLQRDAVEAVRVGIAETDRLWKQRSGKYGTPEIPLAQVALVALDAQTGEIKALVGGRSYNGSQLDRAVAKRQPGSSFKPFVYAAALSTALNRRGPLLTAASTVEDEPTTFYFGGKTYEPGDYEGSYAGPVTLRYAFAHSLNVPAFKIA
jgi:penicillin-binding protein 1B